jgi:hypothetical protein
MGEGKSSPSVVAICFACDCLDRLDTELLRWCPDDDSTPYFMKASCLLRLLAPPPPPPEVEPPPPPGTLSPNAPPPFIVADAPPWWPLRSLRDAANICDEDRFECMMMGRLSVCGELIAAAKEDR